VGRRRRPAVTQADSGRRGDGAPSISDTFLKLWSSAHSCVLLVLLTLACLLPFSERAFHVDDPLFVWAAQRIVKAPADPYGFNLIWDYTRVRMSDVTQNPPLASYYAAAVGRVAGWSERALHLGFLAITLLLILGTYRLAGKFTKYPLLAALATLLTPGLLVSASSVMCDTMMLAFWVWAVVFWMEGLEPERPGLLALAAVLLGLAFLTKYFGAALIPLLLMYSILRLRRVGRGVFYLLIPVAVIWGYQHWTAGLYGQGLMMKAAVYAQGMRAYMQSSATARALMAVSFVGGCSLVPLWIAPLVWPRRRILSVLLGSALFAIAILAGRVQIGRSLGAELSLTTWKQHGILIGAQLALFLAGGFAVLVLALGDEWTASSSGSWLKRVAQRKYWKERSAESWLLGLWVLGTFAFAGFLNWTVNARSVLPLIPAAAILLTRKCERTLDLRTWNAVGTVSMALVASAAVSIWIAAGDAELANTARKTARLVYEKTEGQGKVWFVGHWGFQYYFQQTGGEALDLKHPQAKPGDLIVTPFNNIWTAETPAYPVASDQRILLPVYTGATTISWPLGAGFYSTFWGPLPFAIGPEPLEGARIFRIGDKSGGF